MSWRFFVCGISLAVAGCASENESATPETVLATVGGEVITALDLHRYEQALPDYLHSKKEGVAARGENLQTLVDKELMLSEAYKRGLDQLPGLAHTLSDMVNKRLAEELAREWIDARLKVTEDELRAAFARLGNLASAYSLGYRRRRLGHHPPIGSRSQLFRIGTPALSRRRRTQRR
ncbi:MAG: hypothetical protein OXH63_16745 [Gemmatimonadetes bacterium]|nr:hypothetical protein [Gemmatimonadota bacterium]